LTRAENLLARRWRSLALVAVLLFLSGAVLLVWVKVQTEANRADQLAAEADLRGDAVTTLAQDVRALRAQVQAAGQTPVAEDPSSAVNGLDDRTTVPVPIPGPTGPTGPPGPSGKPAPTITPSPGAPGQPGASGVPGQPGDTVTGPPGQDGQDGKDGRDGVDGQDGQDGRPPAGWSYQWTDDRNRVHTVTCTPVENFDPSAPRYQCTDSVDSPESSGDGGLLGLGALMSGAVYRFDRGRWA
jgi:outer membrane murein-binding lipoprotein Lpp